MKNKWRPLTNKVPYDHPIEKARFVLSTAYYNSDSYSKEELVEAILKSLDHIHKWELNLNDRYST